MKIRRYLARDTQEAILKVKMDLGNDALIINTRKVRQKGLRNLFAKPMVEVLAAIDECYVNAPKKEKQDVQKDIQRDVQRDVQRDAQKDIQKDIQKTRLENEDKKENINILENRVSSMEDMLKKIYDQFQARQSSGLEEGPAGRNEAKLPGIIQVLYNNLLKNDVETEIAKTIMDNVAGRIGENPGVNDAAAALAAEIAAILGKPETIQVQKSQKPVVAMFVGPTGVGKTTTLAKVAANYLLCDRLKVGLITADTYRIAAVEQLRTYGEILGIPVSVVYSAGELGEAISQHSDKDIILIDTAGRSHRSKTQFEELKTMITAADADEIFLVLSTTTSSKNCREILQNYDFLKEFKLVFTKTDEAPLAGIILNARYITGKKLSYITTGQSVPDDIEVANIEKITKSLMGSIS